jgi:hypothetical protein
MKSQGPTGIKEIINAITRQKRWEKGGQILLWRDLWRKAVGPYLFKRTEVVGARGNKALIAVSDSVLASEVSLQKPLILENLQRLGGKKAPRDLIFQVDPSMYQEESPSPAHPPLEPAILKEIEEMTATLQDSKLREGFKRIIINSVVKREKG